MSAADPAALRDLARTIAHEGAALAREMRVGGIDVADTKTSAVDVVTEADRAVEALVRERITAERPDDAILGEEGDDLPGTSGVRWVVDPIDGTVNYLYGLPDCAVSIAAEVDGEVVAGAVVDHPHRHGVRRRAGPRRHPRRPAPSAYAPHRRWPSGWSSPASATSAPSASTRPPASPGCCREVRDIRRMGSCALDLCHVAEGSADAYVEAGPQPWDWSAGGLVLREAGGRFELLDGTMTLPGTRFATSSWGHPRRAGTRSSTRCGAAGFLA